MVLFSRVVHYYTFTGTVKFFTLLNEELVYRFSYHRETSVFPRLCTGGDSKRSTPTPALEPETSLLLSPT